MRAKRTLQVAVKRGSDALDKAAPGWYNEINLDNLDLSDCKSCVAGQLIQKQVIKNISMVSNGRVFPPELGFDVCRAARQEPFNEGREFRALEEIWTRRILRLQAADKKERAKAALRELLQILTRMEQVLQKII